MKQTIVYFELILAGKLCFAFRWSFKNASESIFAYSFFMFLRILFIASVMQETKINEAPMAHKMFGTSPKKINWNKNEKTTWLVWITVTGPAFSRCKAKVWKAWPHK